MQTSRWRLLDAVNLMAENIALASHYQELLNVYRFDVDNAADELQILELNTKIENINTLLSSCIKIRRDIMSEIDRQFQWDKQIWCAFKHSVWSYQYATECLYANQESLFRKDMQQKCYEDMVSVLWLFCGLKELIACSRCLEDQLLDSNK